MSFVDRLKAYLARVRKTGAADGADLLYTDPAWVEARFVELIDRDEKRDRSKRGKASRDRLLKQWMDGGRLPRFAEELASLLEHGFMSEATPAEFRKAVEVALAQLVGIPARFSTSARTLALDRLRYQAEAEAQRQGGDERWISHAQYASEIRATARTDSAVIVTPIGRVLLELTGRDALQWLLTVETLQSTGVHDEWRLSRETARALIKQDWWMFDWGEEHPNFPHSWPTIERLSVFGVVRLVNNEEAERTRLDVPMVGRELLKAVSSDDSPMSVLTATLLRDQLHSTIAVTTGTPPPSPGADAQARQAKLVAHELRNVLFPLKADLAALNQEFAGAADPNVKTLRAAVDNAVERMFHFVDDLTRTAAIAATPPEPFDIVAAMRDAISNVGEAQRLPIGWRSDGTTQLAVLVTGHRDRAVLAFVNLLRNAAQATQGRTPRLVEVTMRATSRRIVLQIDDNGPGVPEERRQTIFEEGVSFRPGGTGLGLALVRDVVERELGGKVVCETSDLGGARFTVTLPVTGAP